jgi:hypothetical protein
MAFNLKKMTHDQLVEEMEKAVLTQTSVPLKFRFELCSDGNLDLYTGDRQFTKEDIKKMVEAGWFDADILDEIEEMDADFCPFKYHEDTLAQSHELFQFILAKTFGEGAKIAGVEELDDCVLLNVAIPT